MHCASKMQSFWDAFANLRKGTIKCVKSYILLTVHLVMILGKWPTWRTILFYVFISIFYVFRATSCSLLGESIVRVSIQHLVYVTPCRWTFRAQVGKELSNLHTKRSRTQNDIYQMLYRYNLFSWWWARGCSKHVEIWNTYIRRKELCVKLVIYQESFISCQRYDSS